MSRRALMTSAISLVTTCVIVMALASSVVAQTQPTLTVGYYDNAPLAYRDASGLPTGLMPEILDEIAEREGWTIEYRFFSWPEGLSALEAGEIDAYGVIAYTAERAKTFDYTAENLYSNWGQVVVPETTEGTFESVLDLSGLRIAVLEGDIHYTGEQGIVALTESFDVETSYMVVDSYSEVLDAVSAGQADAGVVNRLVASTDARDADLRQSPIIFNPVEVRIAFSRDSELSEVIERIDHHLGNWLTDADSPYYSSLEEHFPALTQIEMPEWLIPAGIAAVILSFMLVAAIIYLRWQVASRTSELRESNDRLEALLDNIPEAVLVIDPQDRIEFFKPSPDFDAALPKEAIVGRALAEVPIGMEIEEAIVPAIQRSRETGDVEYVEYPRKSPGEPTRYFTAAMKATDRGGVVIAIREITGQHREKITAEERANELEILVNERADKLVAANLELETANRAKTVFLARVSHELRTPLNSVIGFSKVLMQGLAGELNDEQTRQVEMINRAGENLLSLVNEVLDLSRLESGGLEPEPTGFSLEFLVTETVNEFEAPARDKGLLIRCDTSGAPSTVYTDRRMLQQILRNLIDNAVKFTDEGSVHVNAHSSKADTIVVEITDTGPGMSPLQSEHIFELFYRAAPEDSRIAGFGVGLSICDRLVRLLHGRIDFASVAGDGTTFRVLLPRVLGEGTIPPGDRD